MDQKINSHVKNSNVAGDYVGGNQIKNNYITKYENNI